MNAADASLDRPLWLRVLQFPLTRIVVLGGVLVQFMAWATPGSRPTRGRR